jgi:hypothetical protein
MSCSFRGPHGERKPNIRRRRDVRVTADGQLVAFHDARLHRVTGVGGRVTRFTLDELTAYAGPS